jgi:hypothetical protein
MKITSCQGVKLWKKEDRSEKNSSKSGVKLWRKEDGSEKNS